MGPDRKNSDHKQDMKHWLHEEQRMVDEAGIESHSHLHCFALLPWLHYIWNLKLTRRELKALFKALNMCCAPQSQTGFRSNSVCFYRKLALTGIDRDVSANTAFLPCQLCQPAKTKIKFDQFNFSPTASWFDCLDFYVFRVEARSFNT